MLQVHAAAPPSIPDSRSKIFEGVDRMLSWILPSSYLTYPLEEPLKEIHYQISVPELENFALNHGYFSPSRPLIGIVTNKEEDVVLVTDLLKTIYEKIKEPESLLFVTAEILTKALAYRELKEGREIAIPVLDPQGKAYLAVYVVDKVFNLWHGMPAFGLIPKAKGSAAPILLFRGTDFSLSSPKSWASILTDLDMRGVGLTAYNNARSLFHYWLIKATSFGAKARLMGYSLGGTLAQYTLLYEEEFISATREDLSFVFNCAGLNDEMVKEWDEHEEKIVFAQYLTQGDFVAVTGPLIGEPYAFTPVPALKPIAAHVELLSAHPNLSLFRVEPNRKRILETAFHQNPSSDFKLKLPAPRR